MVKEAEHRKCVRKKCHWDMALEGEGNLTAETHFTVLSTLLQNRLTHIWETGCNQQKNDLLKSFDFWNKTDHVSVWNESNFKRKKRFSSLLAQFKNVSRERCFGQLRMNLYEAVCLLGHPGKELSSLLRRCGKLSGRQRNKLLRSVMNSLEGRSRTVALERLKRVFTKSRSQENVAREKENYLK